MFTVPDYDIIHPVQVDEHGSYVTHELSYPRIRRSGSDTEERADDVHYKLKAFDRDLHLNLRRNARLLAPGFQVEVLGKTGQVLKRHAVDNCYYTGGVRNGGRATVALSNCDGLVSMSSHVSLLWMDDWLTNPTTKWWLFGTIQFPVCRGRFPCYAVINGGLLRF